MPHNPSLFTVPHLGRIGTNVATVTINVLGDTDPPSITSTPITTAIVDQPYTYDVEATDPDSGDLLTFSVDTAPAGMTIDPQTGVDQLDADHRTDW